MRSVMMMQGHQKLGNINPESEGFLKLCKIGSVPSLTGVS